jgi:serine/threonine protein kinase
MFILLSGQPPFKGKNHKEIFEKIKSGKYSFAGTEWKYISKEAKFMIKRMLTFDPEERISAEEALNEEWIKGMGGSGGDANAEIFQSPIMMDILNNIKTINVSIFIL